MKKITILLSAGLVLAMSSSVEAGGSYAQGWGIAPQTSFYAGGSVGGASQSQFEEGSSQMGKLYGGVRLNKAFGFEAGYTRLGEVTSDGLNEPGGRLPATLKSDTQGIYAVGVGYMPITQRVELLGKAGAMWWDQANNKDVPDIDTHTQSGDNGISPVLGVGAQYHLGPLLHLRGEWEHAFNTGEESEYETDVDMLSVGVTFSTL